MPLARVNVLQELRKMHSMPGQTCRHSLSVAMNSSAVGMYRLPSLSSISIPLFTPWPPKCITRGETPVTLRSPRPSGLSRSSGKRAAGRSSRSPGGREITADRISFWSCSIGICFWRPSTGSIHLTFGQQKRPSIVTCARSTVHVVLKYVNMSSSESGARRSGSTTSMRLSSSSCGCDNLPPTFACSRDTSRAAPSGHASS
mmetsp:Transcript_34610/g.72835  ORF Transcript_34610/g.72835 Transcript_34610/m.72835 type:complete len:201 (-) Transcript_34610:193-795(-)